MKRKWFIIVIVLVGVVFCVVCFWPEPPQPLVAFRLKGPATAVNKRQSQFQMEIINNSRSQRVFGTYEIEQKDDEGNVDRIIYSPGTNLWSTGVPLLHMLEPGSSNDIDVLTEAGNLSTHQYRMIVTFLAPTKFRQNLNRVVRSNQILREFVPSPERHRATSEWFRVTAPMLTNLQTATNTSTR